MFKVAVSSFCWSVGPWRVTQRDLQGISGMMLNEYKTCLKMRPGPSESEAHFHRRVAIQSRTLQPRGQLIDLDAYVLGRMYDYMGHVVRMGARDKQFLPHLALCHRDKSRCLQHQEIIGHQGHAKRVLPWTHERPYYDYFSGHSLDWQEPALEA